MINDLLAQLQKRIDYDRRHYKPDPLLSEVADLIEDQHGQIKRLLTANRVLRQGLHGLIDSEDASEVASLLVTGQAIDWDAYPEATKRAILWSNDDD